MARLKNVEKLAQLIGGRAEQFSDNSGTWVSLEDENFEICFSFDGKGNKFEGVRVSQKIYEVVEYKTIALIQNK